jgi:hypothetical protein
MSAKLVCLKCWPSRIVQPLVAIACGLGVALVSLPAFTQSSASPPSSLFAFCMAGKPASDTTLQTVFDAQCPAYLQSQFAVTAASNAASAAAAKQAQETSQASLYAQVEQLMKAPPTQIPASGVDISSLAAAATVKDAQMTYQAAATAGSELQPDIDNGKKAILVLSAGDLQAILSTSVDAPTVTATLLKYSDSLVALNCTPRAAAKRKVPAPAAKKPPVKGGQVVAHPEVAGVDDALLYATLVTVAGTVSTALQPSLVAAGRTTGVSDPGLLIGAGLATGLADHKSGLIVHAPTINQNNTVIIALGNFRRGLAHATAQLSNCNNDPDLDDKKALLAAANAYLSSVMQVSGSSPSALAVAAQKAALSDSNISNVLFIQRDVSGGGVSAVKPSYFVGTRLVMAGADVLTYQLTALDGGSIVAANIVTPKPWAEVCDLDQWQNAFGTGCGSQQPNAISSPDVHH